MDTDHGGSTKYPLMAKEWKLSEFKRLTAFAQQLADPEHKAHALSYLENHDQVRSLPSAFSQRRSERRRLTLPHHLPSHPPLSSSPSPRPSPSSLSTLAGSLRQPLRIGRPRAPSCVVQAPLDLPPHALGLDHHLPGPCVFVLFTSLFSLCSIVLTPT